jgi:type VI secretion system protein ImpH
MKQGLLERAGLANFYRLCELLELSDPESPLLGARDTQEGDAVRFRPWPGMGFPAGEVRYQPGRFEDEHLPVPALFTTFLGLYGVDGVLPYHFATDIVTRREGSEVLAAFLDIFHHRLITQYYRIWRKYHYPVGFAVGGRDRISMALQGLVGRSFHTSSQSQNDIAQPRWLSLLGPMSRRTRTADGLAAVVGHIFPDVGVKVEEFYPSSDLLDAMPLGRKTGLGGQCGVLGRRLVSHNRAVRLVLSLNNAEQLHSLLPGGQARADLAAMLRGYLGLRWTVCLFARLATSSLPAPTIGKHGGWLGLGAYLQPAKQTGQKGEMREIPLGTLNG